MQNDAAVFRTQETLEKGCKDIDEVVESYKDIGIQDRSMVWNTDLIEAMELENLLINATVTMHSAEARKVGRVGLHGRGCIGDSRLGSAAGQQRVLLLAAQTWLWGSVSHCNGNCNQTRSKVWGPMPVKTAGMPASVIAVQPVNTGQEAGQILNSSIWPASRPALPH